MNLSHQSEAIVTDIENKKKEPCKEVWRLAHRNIEVAHNTLLTFCWLEGSTKTTSNYKEGSESTVCRKQTMGADQ